MNINKVTEGSLAKNNKLNEVIQALNSLLAMEVREGQEGETVGLTVSDNKCLLISTASSNVITTLTSGIDGQVLRSDGNGGVYWETPEGC